jgi:hypothetical protein
LIANGAGSIFNYVMLFRTKVITAFLALVAVAIGCAAVLMVSTWQSASNNVRANLAHDNLSGYFQLYGAVFRTFKLARRDLLSGPDGFTFDFDAAAGDIRATLTRSKPHRARRSPSGEAARTRKCSTGWRFWNARSTPHSRISTRPRE